MNEIDKNELMNKISESVLKKGKDNKDTEKEVHIQVPNQYETNLNRRYSSRTEEIQKNNSNRLTYII